MNNAPFLSNLWRWKCGLPEREVSAPERLDIEELRRTQMSARFIELMTNRMVLGTFRYGKWQENKKKYDRIASVEKRLELFKQTGNAEHLVDIANLLMIEFEISDHPNFHFAPIDDGHHVQQK